LARSASSLYIFQAAYANSRLGLSTSSAPTSCIQINMFSARQLSQQLETPWCRPHLLLSNRDGGQLTRLHVALMMGPQQVPETQNTLLAPDVVRVFLSIPLSLALSLTRLPSLCPSFCRSLDFFSLCFCCVILGVFLSVFVFFC
jgi:hypothetical protein